MSSFKYNTTIIMSGIITINISQTYNPLKNKWENDKLFGKVEFLRHTERVKFRFQSHKSALKNEKHKDDLELGYHRRYNGHVTH